MMRGKLWLQIWNDTECARRTAQLFTMQKLGFRINRDAREVRRVELPEEVAADQREHDR